MVIKGARQENRGRKLEIRSHGVSFIVVEIEGINLAWFQSKITSTIPSVLVNVVGICGAIQNIWVQIIIRSAASSRIGEINVGILGGVDSSKIQCQDSVDVYPHIVIPSKLEELVSLEREEEIGGEGKSIIQMGFIISESLIGKGIKGLVVEGINQTVANPTYGRIIGGSEIDVESNIKGVGINIPHSKLSGIRNSVRRCPSQRRNSILSIGTQASSNIEKSSYSANVISNGPFEINSAHPSRIRNFARRHWGKGNRVCPTSGLVGTNVVIGTRPDVSQDTGNKSSSSGVGLLGRAWILSPRGAYQKEKQKSKNTSARKDSWLKKNIQTKERKNDI
jgi:hypothetical protein